MSSVYKGMFSLYLSGSEMKEINFANSVNTLEREKLIVKFDL